MNDRLSMVWPRTVEPFWTIAWSVLVPPAGHQKIPEGSGVHSSLRDVVCYESAARLSEQWHAAA